MREGEAKEKKRLEIAESAKELETPEAKAAEVREAFEVEADEIKVWVEEVLGNLPISVEALRKALARPCPRPTPSCRGSRPSRCRR